MEQGRSLARARLAWALYDWANSPFTTLIVTFVFPVYFAQAVVGDRTQGQAQWAFAMSVSGLAVALSGPVLGAVADVTGRRKPWLAGFSALCVAASAALWLVEPKVAAAPLAWGLVVAANLGYEGANVFYNAMLPEVAGTGRIGRLSGWAWGLGYAGGLAALVVALVALVPGHIRWVGPLCAAWLAVFALPLLLWTPEGLSRPVGRGDLGAALASLRRSLARAARLDAVGRFLLAHMLYADGLVTLFAMGGVFVAGVHGFTMQQVLGFGILLNVTAGLGAAGFGWVDDRLGSKRTILIALAGLLAAGAAVLSAEGGLAVWGFGAALGLFVGPAQAASRSLLARLAPPEARTELFGLYALAGKATAFAGPALVGLVTQATGSQRLGMAVVLGFFLAGGLVLLSVPEE